MTTAPIPQPPSAAPPTVSEQLHDQLLRGILTGTPPAGEPLPSERQLAETHGVNRHAVREAIKRLQQSGLVTVSQGGATRVRDWRRHGGLDLLPRLAGIAGSIPEVIRDVMEARASLGADVARRAAERIGDGQLELLAQRAGELREAPDDVTAALRYTALWDVIVDACGNVAYQLAYNGLVAGEAELGELALALHLPELHDPDGIDALLSALAERDPDRAAITAALLLARSLPPRPDRTPTTTDPRGD